MATTMDAISLVKIHFGTKTRQNRHLKKALGMAYYPLLGMFTGYYALDLINEVDRICLHTLLEQSIKNSARRQAAKQGYFYFDLYIFIISCKYQLEFIFSSGVSSDY
jgi:hypothetical protein